MIIEWVAQFFLLAVFAFLLAQDVRHFRGCRRRVQGEVVGHRSSYDEGARTYVARVAYVDHFGQRHEIEDSRGSAREQPSVGTTMPVDYPESHPGKGRVPHPAIRAIVYGFLITASAALSAKMIGWVQ